MPTQGLLVNVEVRPIFQAIQAERLRQVHLGFSAEHDDKLALPEWVAILARQVGLLTDDGAAPPPYERIIRQLVRTAAACVAALEVLARAGIVIPAGLTEEKHAGPTEDQRGP